MVNITKDHFVELIHSKIGISKKDADAIIETILDEITVQIKKGNKVTFTGFGVFRVNERAARVGINPQTKGKIQIPAMSVPKFTAGKALKEAVR